MLAPCTLELSGVLSQPPLGGCVGEGVGWEDPSELGTLDELFEGVLLGSILAPITESDGVDEVVVLGAVLAPMTESDGVEDCELEGCECSA